MPGIGSTLNKDWAACGPHHHLSTSRPVMTRPSLPPVSATQSFAVAHDDAVQPRWTTRHSTPPTVSATERSLSPIPALSPGYLTPPSDHDLDSYVTWTSTSSLLYPQSHGGSPTGSNNTTEDDWSDLNSDYNKLRSTSSSLSSDSSLSSSSRLQVASDGERTKSTKAAVLANSVSSRRPVYAQDNFEEVAPTRAPSNAWLKTDTARPTTGDTKRTASTRSPAYTAGVLPKYRATEPVLCDRRYEEALRIANSDFDRRQREANAIRHQVELAGLLHQVGNLSLESITPVSTSDRQDLKNKYSPYVAAAPNNVDPIKPQIQTISPYPVPTVAQRSYSYLLPPAYTSTHLPRDSLSIASDPFAPPVPTATPLDLVHTVDHLPPVGPAPSSKKKESLYKTELCRGYEERGHCDYGAKCQFAHGKHELRSIERHPKWKTERCRTYWRYGTCPYAKRCCFIHEASEGDMSAGVSPPEAVSKAPLLARVRAISENASLPLCQVDVESQPYASFARSAPSFVPKSIEQQAHQQHQLQQQRSAYLLSTLGRGVSHQLHPQL